MGNKNGIAKNWEVVQRELSAWRALRPIHLKTYRDVPWSDPIEKLHKGWNLATEFIRIAPRTAGYSALIIVVWSSALIWLLAWLWLR